MGGLPTIECAAWCQFTRLLAQASAGRARRRALTLVPLSRSVATQPWVGWSLVFYHKSHGSRSRDRTHRGEREKSDQRWVLDKEDESPQRIYTISVYFSHPSIQDTALAGREHTHTYKKRQDNIQINAQDMGEWEDRFSYLLAPPS
jgi:hypothetical protein